MSLQKDFLAAIAGADDAEADAVVGSKNVGCGKGSGDAGCDFADEITARLHS